MTCSQVVRHDYIRSTNTIEFFSILYRVRDGDNDAVGVVGTVVVDQQNVSLQIRNGRDHEFSSREADFLQKFDILGIAIAIRYVACREPGYRFRVEINHQVFGINSLSYSYEIKTDSVIAENDDVGCPVSCQRFWYVRFTELKEFQNWFESRINSIGI